ncbi:MAG: dethiobiotin synthase [Bacteroidetes bacterium]|nr:MAG: dethiobiotin synthase [Bacteroidota bacterium]PTM10111.1 MAG: dethiobiotin synthase [Bacteroidota bacterium]
MSNSSTIPPTAQQFFVTGISTEVGKTVCSALLVKALEADYWKPVQSGDLHLTDTMKVAHWTGTSLPSPRFHPETYRLTEPLSPHASAALDGIRIELDRFQLPATGRPLIVEGAGGLLVPLNEKDTVLDLMERLQLPVILVSRNYLGSINHTLLSIAQLRQRGIPLAGLVFSGNPVPASEAVIEQLSGARVLFRIPEFSALSLPAIADAAEGLRKAGIFASSINPI